VTTIDLTPEQEEVLRRWQGADPSRLTDELRVIAQLADRLPAPPYVPAVGDKIVAYWLEKEGTGWRTPATYERGEEVLTVTGTYVITIDRGNDNPNPDVWSYRIDAHRFEKVEQ
jgi:hypothetical protein